jgi:hypothetical protein
MCCKNLSTFPGVKKNFDIVPDIGICPICDWSDALYLKKSGSILYK